MRRIICTTIPAIKLQNGQRRWSQIYRKRWSTIHSWKPVTWWLVSKLKHYDLQYTNMYVTHTCMVIVDFLGTYMPGAASLAGAHREKVKYYRQSVLRHQSMHSSIWEGECGTWLCAEDRDSEWVNIYLLMINVYIYCMWYYTVSSLQANI